MRQPKAQMNARLVGSTLPMESPAVNGHKFRPGAVFHERLVHQWAGLTKLPN